jgi:dUTP pyrophosphatase
MSVNILFKRLSPDAVLPQFKSRGAAGADLYTINSGVIPAWDREVFPLGFMVAIPEDFEIQIRPRSGLSLKYGVTVANSPGTVDSDYRGEMMVILANYSNIPYEVKAGDRIAQAIVSTVPVANFTEVEHLDDTERGENGFGSTGR